MRKKLQDLYRHRVRVNNFSLMACFSPRSAQFNEIDFLCINNHKSKICLHKSFIQNIAFDTHCDNEILFERFSRGRRLCMHFGICLFREEKKYTIFMVRYSNKCQVTSVDIFYTNTKNFPLSLAFTFASPLSNHQQYRTQRPKRGRVQKKKQQTIFKPNTDRTYAQEQIHFMLTFGNFTTYTLLCCLFLVP